MILDLFIAFACTMGAWVVIRMVGAAIDAFLNR